MGKAYCTCSKSCLPLAQAAVPILHIHSVPMLTGSAGTMPWVSRDLMQWPVATGNEGLIDVVVQSVVRSTLHAS